MSDDLRYEPLDDGLPPDEDGSEPRPVKPAPIRPTLRTVAPTPTVAKPIPPIPHHTFSIRLPALLADRINTVRHAAGLEPIDAALWYRSPALEMDSARAAQLTADLTARRLPLNLTVSKVYAAVHGAAEFNAGWHGGDALAALQQSLIAALELSEQTEMEPLILAGVNVPAERFPYLVAALQRDFAPTSYDDVTLTLETL